MNRSIPKLWLSLCLVFVLPVWIASCAYPPELMIQVGPDRVRATEFREYTDATKNTGRDWWFALDFDEVSLIDARAVRFDAFAHPIPQIGFDSPALITTAGLLKFNFPPPEYDGVLEWHAVVNIDLPAGAIVREEHDVVTIDLVMREQPNSTSFPIEGPLDGGFEWIECGDQLDVFDPNAPNWLPRTKVLHLTGDFEVKRGVQSSLIMGPSVQVWSASEWASIGHEADPYDNGRFFLGGFVPECFSDIDIGCGLHDLVVAYKIIPQSE